jgi:hypothetical protein
MVAASVGFSGRGRKILITKRWPLRNWMARGALIGKATLDDLLSVVAFVPKENDKLSLKIDPCVA